MYLQTVLFIISTLSLVPSLVHAGSPYCLPCYWPLTGATLQVMFLIIFGVAAIIAGGQIIRGQRLLKQQAELIQLNKERLQLVIDGTIDGIWDWPDARRDEIYWSPRWKALLGYKDDELVASKELFMKLLHPDDVEPLRLAIKACLEKDALFDIEYRLKKKSGEYGWFHGKGVVTHNADITRLTGSITDITERKFSETIRDRLIKQLSDTNEQLEQFAYVASHDLREPLRIVVSFSDLLQKEYGKLMNEEGAGYLDIIRQASMKMEAMVADLLDYGRLEQESERYIEINCNDQLEQVIESLADPIQATNATIHSSELPKIMASPWRFSRLLQNLLSNAMKYQPSGNRPIIHVSADDCGDHWRFAVSDNGLGIKPDYHEMIFAPFKRLHRDQEFAGTGIGLAICRKIVNGLGGTLWVESTYGEGSTFYFTVPKPHRAAPQSETSI